MRILTKEFHQQKWVLLSGCLAGLAFPIMEYSLINRPGKHETNSGVIAVLFAGAFFGILLAAATTWHDARKGAGNFLLARPFNCSRIFITKVLLAAVSLLAVMLLVSSIDIATNLGRERGFSLIGLSIVSLTWPIALMLFALTMFLMVVTQDPAKSVLVAAWAGLLVYFLPVMLNGLQWLSFFWLMDNMEKSLFSLFPESYSRLLGIRELASGRHISNVLPYLCFLGSMLLAAATFTWLAIKAMKNRWHWHPGQKTIVWTMGIASAVIFAQAMFQVGQNLQPLKEYSGKPIAPSASIESGQESDPIFQTDDFRFLIRRIGHTFPDERVQSELVLYTFRFPWLADASPVPANNAYKAFQAGSLTICTQPPATKPDDMGLVPVGCVVKDNLLYTFYNINDSNEPKWWQHPSSLHMAIIDVSDPARPVLRSDAVIGTTMHIRSGGFAASGDYCYINAGDRLIVVSLAIPDKPSVVAEVAYTDIVKQLRDTLSTEGDRMYGLPLTWNTRLIVSGHLLVAHNGYHVALFDIAEPERPRALLCQLQSRLLKTSGASPSWALAWNGDHCYIATGDGIFVFKLLKGHGDTYSLSYVGHRMTTPLERFVGRYPNQLVVYDGYLVEAAGRFGLLVYDISDPAGPRRIYHASVPGCNRVGTWRGLLYTQSWGNEMTFFSLPKAP
jgi:hypothetical protein